MFVSDEDYYRDLEKRREEERRLTRLRARNNPNDEPIGHYTGRCSQCGSKDLWDDPGTFHYGCKSCGAFC